MKTRLRFALLLPMKGQGQQLAAYDTLADIKQEFGETGGTWFATQAFEPIVSGWWDDPDNTAKRIAAIKRGVSETEALRDFPIVEDPHIMVTVDVDAAPAAEQHAVDTLIDAFVSRYRGRGIAQKVVYIARQDVTVHELPGARLRKRTDK